MMHFLSCQILLYKNTILPLINLYVIRSNTQDGMTDTWIRNRNIPEFYRSSSTKFVDILENNTEKCKNETETPKNKERFQL